LPSIGIYYVYLKQLDILGFKSFADKTRLTFEPGMIAIVGPNGCGKSNVSDAIRWVLGEQRPTAIRCSKLVDVLFNGTDTRKPLSACEVTITFADCEKELGTEYHEVTVSRRVFRDGSGEYYINKVRCGLKDVKRLFMGTGIGTSSYSVMAQGQIDAILSSKPEDRRAVFEEAAGITKFKADRKEALRKIEQTEQNLLREADVLREMKRQIGSLQRQVGKAQRYKELRDELRGLDIFTSKGKICDYAEALESNASAQRDTEQAIADATETVNAAERAAQELHAQIHAIEEKLAGLATEAAAAEGAYARAQEVISVNGQRIAEYRSFADRDGREIADARKALGEIKLQAESLAQKTALLSGGLETAKKALAAAEQTFAESSRKIDALRDSVRNSRSESVACDRAAADARDALAALESAAREVILEQQRLASEEARFKADAAASETACAEVKARLDAAKAAEAAAAAKAQAAADARDALAAELEDLRAHFGDMQAEAAAKEAQLDLLEDAKSAADAFAAGARALLDGTVKLPEGAVLGPLADRFDASAEYRTALEAALRAWLDAVVVKDADAARAAVEALVSGEAGSARLVALDVHGAKSVSGDRLLDHVSVPDDFKAAAEALLGDVVMAEGPVAGATAVTKDGIVYRADGTCEVWRPGAGAASPLSRKMMISETREALDALRARIEEGRAKLETGAADSAARAEAARAADRARDEARRAAAQVEGEYASVERDALVVKSRLSDVSVKLQSVLSAHADDTAKRDALKKRLDETLAKRDALLDRAAAEEESLRNLEVTHAEASRTLTEKRIAVGQMEAELEFTSRQNADTAHRREELEKTIAGRESGIRGYEDSVQRLLDETAELTASLDDLRAKAADVRTRVESEKAARGVMQGKLAEAEAAVGGRRAELDKARDMKSRLEVAAAESQMRLQNVYEHLNQEYGLDAQAVVREPDPDWKGEVPPREQLEARVNELNAKIAELGPVNMVAIDEFRELEERYAKEKEQEADLLAAKERILALITDLNGKSGEMFRATFEQADANFRRMFTKLFNGGEARLVLLENQEDPLECGIDIIARPPGKRPQSVTLLSGGERTMTAVALLFAIFMIKPAPFCMLDELDAALDDANIGRFVEALKEFLDRSQFLIITHNQHTIAGSDLVYGVSQQEKGISRIVSMRLSEIGVKETAE